MQTTSLIQNQLEKVLKRTILSEIPFEIDQRWTGIMGVGQSKVPIVKQLSSHVYCGVKLGGMGVAIGAQVGAELAELCH
jgi:thiamine pyrophosphate-dependent acetolactate synthase large subunit-like protein